MEEKFSKSFEEGWPLIQKNVDRLIKEIVEVDNNPTFTTREFMSFYTSVVVLSNSNPEPVYYQYKKVFEEYLNTTVLPSLLGKTDELLLKELVKRWSNHKMITKWLSGFFRHLESMYIRGEQLPSLEETAFLSFYDLVYERVDKQVMEAVLAMIDQDRVGKQIDRTLVNDLLAVYTEIGDSTGRNNPKHFAEKMIKEIASLHYDDEASIWIAARASWAGNTHKEDGSTASTNKIINLITSDGAVFEVDYHVLLLSKTIKHLVAANPADIDSGIPLARVDSEMLDKIIEYCKEHNKQHMSDADLMEWDADFIGNLDKETTLYLLQSASYLSINCLMDLLSNKISDMLVGKRTESEIKDFFGENFSEPEP